MFGIGMFCILAGVGAIVFGYVVPVFALPRLSDNVWTPAIPAVARYALPVVIVAAVVLCVGGLALMIGAAVGPAPPGVAVAGADPPLLGPAPLVLRPSPGGPGRSHRSGRRVRSAVTSAR